MRCGTGEKHEKEKKGPKETDDNETRSEEEQVGRKIEIATKHAYCKELCLVDGGDEADGNTEREQTQIVRGRNKVR